MATGFKVGSADLDTILVKKSELTTTNVTALINAAGGAPTLADATKISGTPLSNYYCGSNCSYTCSGTCAGGCRSGCTGGCLGSCTSCTGACTSCTGCTGTLSGGYCTSCGSNCAGH